MALYDPNDLVTAVHPVTGAPFVLPRAVAAQFPTLQIMQQPQAATMGDGSVRNFADGSVHNLGTAPIVPGDTGQAVDEVAPSPSAPNKPKAAAPSAVQPGIGVPQAAMDQAAAAVPNAPPPPVTTADLLNGGQARAVNMQSQATEEQKQGARDQAAAEAAQSRQLGDEYANELQRQDDIDRQRVATAQAKLNQINQKSAQIDSAIDSVSKMRVDNSIAHPLLAAISLALGGVGAALNHSMDNPALNVLNKQIAQNVQTQMANINNARGAVSMQQGQLANMRAQFTDQNALYDAMTAAETRRAQIMVNQIAQRSNSAIVKAKAQQIIGQLSGAQAKALGDAATQEVAANDRQTGLKLEKRGQDISAYEQGQNRQQSAKQFGEDLDFRKKQEADEMQAKADALTQSGNIAAAKMLMDKRQQFLTGGMMTPTKLVAQSDGTYTPGGYQPATQEDGTVYIMPKGREKDIQEYNTYTDQAIQAIDKVRELRAQNGGHLADTAEAREAAQEAARALMAMQNLSGTKRWSAELADIMNKKLTGGADVNSVIRDVMPNLETARKDLIQDQHTYMINANYTGTPRAYPDPTKMPRAPVSDESMLKTAPENPQPNATDFNQTLLSLRDAEQMLYSGDPAKQQTALKVLHDPSIKDRKTQEVAHDIINHYITAGANGGPLLPDPNANPTYYTSK